MPKTTDDLKMMTKVILLAIAALELSACSKAVSWEEEVPLNNGTTIWVKRTQEYSYQGGEIGRASCRERVCCKV